MCYRVPTYFGRELIQPSARKVEGQQFFFLALTLFQVSFGLSHILFSSPDEQIPLQQTALLASGNEGYTKFLAEKNLPLILPTLTISFRAQKHLHRKLQTKLLCTKKSRKLQLKKRPVLHILFKFSYSRSSLQSLIATIFISEMKCYIFFKHTQVCMYI